MGRYYNGDIEGKFWFGVQDSTDADFFGGQTSEPNYVNYSFEADDLPTIKKGITECKKKLGKNLAKLTAFFAEGGEGYNGYTDKKIADCLGIKWTDRKSNFGNTEVSGILEWYARLELGNKILKCVKDTGYCNFEAEL